MQTHPCTTCGHRKFSHNLGRPLRCRVRRCSCGEYAPMPCTRWSYIAAGERTCADCGRYYGYEPLTQEELI